MVDPFIIFITDMGEIDSSLPFNRNPPSEVNAPEPILNRVVLDLISTTSASLSTNYLFAWCIGPPANREFPRHRTNSLP